MAIILVFYYSICSWKLKTNKHIKNKTKTQYSFYLTSLKYNQSNRSNQSFNFCVKLIFKWNYSMAGLPCVLVHFLSLGWVTFQSSIPFEENVVPQNWRLYQVPPLTLNVFPLTPISQHRRHSFQHTTAEIQRPVHEPLGHKPHQNHCTCLVATSSLYF